MSFIAATAPVVSTSNSTTATLAGSATYTGTWEECWTFASISVMAKADVAGTLYLDFSPDGSNADRQIQLSDGTSGDFGIHSLTPVAKYYRVRLVNGGSGQAYLRLQTLLHPHGRISFPTSRLGQTLGNYSDVLNVRAALVGQQDGGDFVPVPVTPEGHVEVAIHGPRDAFGDIKMTQVTPKFQASFGYGINSEQFDQWTTTGGTISAASGQVTVAIDTTANARARLSARRILHYRPGQGGIVRFTALFSTGAASSYMVAGPIGEEHGFAFGRNGTALGVLHRKGGQRNIRTLTVTVGAGGAETATVTLDGSTKNVALTSGTTTFTAYQLATADYSATGDGWDAEQIGATVVFIARRAKSTAGAFTLSSTGTAAGTWANTLAGAAPTDNWTAAASWNDPMDGTGPSGNTLDATKGNVYEVNFQYLGYGPAFYKLEYLPSGGNDPDWAYVYTLPYNNANTTPSMARGSVPFAWEVVSQGSTTAMSVKGASVMFGVEGQDVAGIEGPTLTGENTSVGTTEIPILSIRNGRTFGGSQTNYVGVRLDYVTVSCKAGSNVRTTVRARRNATLTGTPSFAAAGSSFATYSDTAATGVSGGTVVFSQLYVETTHIREEVVGKTSFYLEPGDVVTITAQTSSGSNGIVAISVEYVEFQ